MRILLNRHSVMLLVRIFLRISHQLDYLRLKWLRCWSVPHLYNNPFKPHLCCLMPYRSKSFER